MFTTIRAKLYGMMLSVLVILLLSFITTFLTLENQKADALIFNTAGKTRVLSQKISKEAFQIQYIKHRKRK
jgi:nitrate/nitrite-specific signal transduction histidine kinase